jgi:glutaredoxin-related protein
VNFEFLKGLRGLGHVYENCNNAEKLAMTMPVQSIITARKSAEQIAKFIYMAAHNEQMESMTFADILKDSTVREFIHNRDVMNAFHNIRKKGNIAVHDECEETVEDAIDVLDDLHLVSGETACTLGLITEYPKFKEEIETFVDANFVPIEDVNDIAREMFLDYVEKYNAQVESDCYYQNTIDNLTNEYESMCQRYRAIPGDADLNEVLIFKTQPVDASSLKPIQAYYGFLAIRALKKLRGELYGELEERDIEFTGELTLYGEDGYTTSDLSEFVYGILHDLPSADGFKIVTEYCGPSVAPWFDENKERKEEFSSEVAEIGKTEELSYSCFDFLHNHGEGGLIKFENGNWINLKSLYTSSIVAKAFEHEWYTWSACISMEFDYDKYPEILTSLRNCVRKHIPEDELGYSEEEWNENENGVLVNDLQWSINSLQAIQDFLDELNSIVEPIKAEFKAYPEGIWYQTTAPFAVAEWDWTDDGFKITGTEL